MVETNPNNPSLPPGDQPDRPPGQGSGPARSLEVPPIDVGFDFVSFVVAIFIVSVLFTGGLYGYRFLILERTLNEQKQQISQLESELKDPKLVTLEKQVLAIDAGIKKIRPILDEKIRYAELLWTIRKVTEKSVRWKTMGFNNEKKLSMVGEAAGWGNVSRQLASLKASDKFNKVELTSAASQTDKGKTRINFAVSMQVLTEKLVPPQQ